MKQFKFEATFDTPEEVQEFLQPKPVISDDNIAVLTKLETSNKELSDKNKNQADIITNLQANNLLLNGNIESLKADKTQLENDYATLQAENLNLKELSNVTPEEIIKNARLEERKGFIEFMNRKYGMVSDNVKNWDVYCEQLLAMRDFQDIKLNRRFKMNVLGIVLLSGFVCCLIVAAVLWRREVKRGDN